MPVTDQIKEIIIGMIRNWREEKNRLEKKSVTSHSRADLNEEEREEKMVMR